MTKEELEQEYGIGISYNGSYYMVFNYFGKLWFTSPSLDQIKQEMERIYSIR